ncbi:MAG: hypothetical protein PHE06_00870 [Lachnospiraceae bacterium]|nr:hypothetical protein [Lachnospiraceae bacterium]
MLIVTGIASIEVFEPRLVLIPFVDFLPSIMQSILNIILFVPFGFLLSIVFLKRSRKSEPKGKAEKKELIVLIAYAWLVMLTIQPWLVNVCAKTLNL